MTLTFVPARIKNKSMCLCEDTEVKRLKGAQTDRETDRQIVAVVPDRELDISWETRLPPDACHRFRALLLCTSSQLRRAMCALVSVA